MALHDLTNLKKNKEKIVQRFLVRVTESQNEEAEYPVDKYVSTKTNSAKL